MIQSTLNDNLPDLARELVASSHAPVVLLDGSLAVVLASHSFSRTFGIPMGDLRGRSLEGIGQGEWNVPQLLSLLRATANGHALVDGYEMDLNRGASPPRHVVVNAQKLAVATSSAVSVLMTVSDVTQERANEKLKDDLLREKAVLLQELQHRIANSLQIIASVLMLSARRVQSDETRAHLYNAHQRVMSLATVQQQLARSRLGDVGLHQYITDLCSSLGASMIRDHDQLSLTVDVDGSSASADVSISLGLLVTELVINALKHAFPGLRKGRISVGYHADGPAWKLQVSDDGVGMARNRADAQPGLGTSIVEALARQLSADVSVEDNHPGTTVSISHPLRAA
jgi:two-component sensor histidine kinase